ncbi:MAG: tetraacyldisaccharide 4-kinase, partial [Pseudomonadota bacterium]
MDMRSESLRAQLERPLSERNVLFAILSVFLLLPLSVVWSFVAYLRLLLRSKRSISSTDDVRVVSVGNVSVGGTGKSPVVRSVALLAFQEGYDVAVLTRGYVSSGSVPQVIVQVRSGFVAEPDTSWTLLSDETLEHALQLQSRVNESHSLWVCQGKDRRVVFDALVAQWRESQAEQASSSPRKLAVIMDDALQQTSIPVHRDLIVWSPETVHKAPQMCLPYGPYRMGLPFRRFWSWAVPTGDVVVWSRLRSLSEQVLFQNLATTAAQKLGLKFIGSDPAQLFCVENLLLTQVRPSEGLGFTLLPECADSLLPERVHLLCGIARPERFG